MLCSRGLKSFFPVYSMMDFYSPTSSLWPGVQPLLCHQDFTLQNMEMHNSKLEEMDKLQRQCLKETDKALVIGSMQAVSQNLKKKGEHFALTLDTKDFSPEELSVKQVGRKLRISGKTEKKQEDGQGSFSYRCQEFRQEFELPAGVNPKAITCSLNKDGKLHIQAAAKPPSYEESERMVPINKSQDERAPQSLSSQKEGSTTDSQRPDSQEDKTETT